jgi:hypothetical protein
MKARTRAAQEPAIRRAAAMISANPSVVSYFAMASGSIHSTALVPSRAVASPARHRAGFYPPAG